MGQVYGFRYFNIEWLSVAKALKIKYIPHLGFVVESYLSIKIKLYDSAVDWFATVTKGGRLRKSTKMN